MHKQRLQLNNISILQIDNDLCEEASCLNIKSLKMKLENLGYAVEKICFLIDDIKKISVEVEMCLLNTHFIMILLDDNHKEMINKCLCEMFHIKSNILEWKHLKNEWNSDCSVLYFQRIFLMDVHAPNESIAIVEKYLLYFLVPKPYIKIIKLKEDCSPNKTADNNTNEVEITAIDTKRFRLVSHKLNALLQCEMDITKNLKEDDYDSYAEFDCYVPQKLINFNKFKEAFKVLDECFEKYAPQSVCICFNGGKDCTVLLHMTLLALHQKYNNYNNLCCLYVESSNPFPEIQVFIKNIAKYYNIKVVSIQASIKDAMEYLKKNQPEIKACLMGTRRTDPYSEKLKTFEMTDVDWPQFMRICPLLDWHYSDIWDYIQTFNLPYCSLYDVGYTSLGNVKNTQANPHLLLHNCIDETGGTKTYLPAYKLINEIYERNGRCNGTK